MGYVSIDEKIRKFLETQLKKNHRPDIFFYIDDKTNEVKKIKKKKETNRIFRDLQT